MIKHTDSKPIVGHPTVTAHILRTGRDHFTWLRCLLATIAVILFFGSVQPVRASFGATWNSGGYWVVNNGANLVLDIWPSGDLWDIYYKGVNYNSTGYASQIASGLNAYSCTVTTNGNALVIACTSTNITGITGSAGEFIHYYIVSNGVDILYMADWVPAEPTIGELRYIMRLNWDLVPNCRATCQNNGASAEIENEVYEHPNGETTSKYYGSQLENTLFTNMTISVNGPGIAVYVWQGLRESSSGGPFFHDIEEQGDGTGSDMELYNYMNSGHNQTEPDRVNVLYGPYAYVFLDNTNTKPTVPDTGFIGGLGLKGQTPYANRGHAYLAGINNMVSTYPYTFWLHNATAQYWGTCDPTTGACTVEDIKAGTYSWGIFKNQLLVAANDGLVINGSETTTNPAVTVNDPSSTTVLWRIGDWDGTPCEFANGGDLTDMHPSDVRESWPVSPKWTYGQNSSSQFPAIQFMDVNTNANIWFVLDGGLESEPHNLKIGVCSAYADGAPHVWVNGIDLGYAAASDQPDSRSVTIGTYRGNNTTFTFTVPAADWVNGWNYITIGVVGDDVYGAYLSPNFSYDCVELDD